MREFSRKAQLLCWMMYLIALPASWAWLPAMVGDGGNATTKAGYVLTMWLTALPLTWLMCGGLLKLVRRYPRWLNLTNKEYWLAPERADQTWQRLDAAFLSLGWLIWVFHAVLLYKTLAGPRVGAPLMSEANFFALVFVLGTALLLHSALKLALGWRVPKATLAAFQAQQEAQPTEGIDSRAIKRPPSPVHTPRFGRGTDHGQPR
jgi:hypothetical protein